MNLNKVFLIGNMTRDPELKALPNGTKVVNFGMATNRTYKNKEGSLTKEAEFHNIVAFARLAELVGQYMKKGSQIYVEGRIQTRSWDGTDGAKKYKTEIIAESIQFGQKGSGAGSGGSKAGKPDIDSKDATPGETIEYPQDDINPDDIPF